MLSKIKIIPEVLNKVTDNVGHYEVFKKTDKYIVWAEDSEGSSLETDNQKTEYSIQGTIDYFTKEDMDSTVDKIHEELANAHIAFYLNSVQYEEETGYIHYEWVWEVA